jgi:hypothetical protein
MENSSFCANKSRSFESQYHLTASHSFPSKASEEFELKGNSLVVILHGSPGSGTTMSAGKSIFQYLLDGDGTRTSGEDLVMIITSLMFFPRL